MDNKKFKIIFIAAAFLIIAAVGIMRANPDFLSGTTAAVATPQQQAPQPVVITLPAWGIVAGGTAFSDYAAGEVRGGIRVAGQVYEEKTSDGTLQTNTKVRVLLRQGNQYQVMLNGYTIWVPLASVTLTGK